MEVDFSGVAGTEEEEKKHETAGDRFSLQETTRYTVHVWLGC